MKTFTRASLEDHLFAIFLKRGLPEPTARLTSRGVLHDLDKKDAIILNGIAKVIKTGFDAYVFEARFGKRPASPVRSLEPGKRTAQFTQDHANQTVKSHEVRQSLLKVGMDEKEADALAGAVTYYHLSNRNKRRA